MRQTLTAALALLALLSASGCSTVLFVREKNRRTYAPPVYELNRPRFFFGLAGPDTDVYLDRICLGKEADQVSTTYTLSNALAGLLTLGIYSPRTVKVWCQL